MNETEFVYISCSFGVINGFESVYSHILLKNGHGELFKVKVGEVRYTNFVKVKVIKMTCTCIFRVQLFLKEEFNLLKLKLSVAQGMIHYYGDKCLCGLFTNES